MDLSKLPPSILMSLGLMSCTQMSVCLSTTGADDWGTETPTTGEMEVGPCLSPPEPETTTGLDTGSGTGTSTGTGTGTGTGTDTDTDTDTGTGTTTGGESTSIGPCLGALMDSSSSDTGTGTDTDGGTSSGGMLDEPPLPSTRAAAVERVLSRNVLPADVLDRLRALTGPGKGKGKGKE